MPLIWKNYISVVILNIFFLLFLAPVIELYRNLVYIILIIWVLLFLHSLYFIFFYVKMNDVAVKIETKIGIISSFIYQISLLVAIIYTIYFGADNSIYSFIISAMLIFGVIGAAISSAPLSKFDWKDFWDHFKS